MNLAKFFEVIRCERMKKLILSLAVFIFTFSSASAMEEGYLVSDDFFDSFIGEMIFVQDISFEAKMALFIVLLGYDIDIKIEQTHWDEAFDWYCAKIMKDKDCIKSLGE